MTAILVQPSNQLSYQANWELVIMWIHILVKDDYLKWNTLKFRYLTSTKAIAAMFPKLHFSF